MQSVAFYKIQPVALNANAFWERMCFSPVKVRAGKRSCERISGEKESRPQGKAEKPEIRTGKGKRIDKY